MHTCELIYKENLRTVSTHRLSGEKIETDAPPDNNGKGERFSPTDILTSSLASCCLTIMAIRAEKSGIRIDGMKALATKYMESNPRRIGKIEIVISVNGSFSPNQKKILEEAALNCPVFLSLSSEMDKKIAFEYIQNGEKEA